MHMQKTSTGCCADGRSGPAVDARENKNEDVEVQKLRLSAGGAIGAAVSMLERQRQCHLQDPAS